MDWGLIQWDAKVSKRKGNKFCSCKLWAGGMNG